MGASFLVLLGSVTTNGLLMPLVLVALTAWLVSCVLFSQATSQRLKLAIVPFVPVTLFYLWQEYSLSYDGFLGPGEGLVLAVIIFGTPVLFVEAVRQRARKLGCTWGERILFVAEICWLTLAINECAQEFARVGLGESGKFLLVLLSACSFLLGMAMLLWELSSADILATPRQSEVGR